MSRFTNLTEAVRTYMQKLRDEPEQLYGTGLAAVDEAIGGGVARGELAIVGARPSHGKTLFAMQWCYEVARRGVRCLIVSEEMAIQALAERVVLHASENEQAYWRENWTGTFDHAMNFMGEGNRESIIVAKPCRTVDAAADAIKDAADNHGVRFVVVDYAQLLRGSGMSRYEQQCNVSTTLKNCATDTNSTLVVCAQLSRSFESDTGGVPKLHHIKESGQWEQDCDVALMPVWPHRLDRKYQPANEYRVFIAKCRNRGIRGHGVEICRIEPGRQKIHDSEAFSGQQFVPEPERFGDEFN